MCVTGESYGGSGVCVVELDGSSSMGRVCYGCDVFFLFKTVMHLMMI